MTHYAKPLGTPFIVREPL